MKPTVRFELTKKQIQQLEVLFDMADKDGLFSAGSIIMQPIRRSKNKVTISGAYFPLKYASKISAIMEKVK